ncbi:hypothetical protein EPUS_04231 [Endocarpon pusillum Z07020]|uniref:Uncharacterized protein n=1 Tax=Endocarpon pusillum (strain Z07020 / HMAS-L-300199) TaxID=1263415 RepID=U1GLM1_ENDPU|nr:uncharacterized protein EPUS_04231 [Endocarpon pusillum Z07020]ERF72796.1 hypothetical protein EPUS_04231 [Endocarpon pusillum Z07020]
MSTSTNRYQVRDDDTPFEVIKKIRCSRGMDVKGKVISDTAFQTFKMLGSALRLLADMNPQPAHFVLEAVQNADDNDYLNVQAICTISESTKTDRPDCTGEKGIGFKSFFKIAVAIHIASRGFSFKFDSRRLCGMIDPEWAEFPQQHERPGTTQFLLELAPDAPRARIQSELRAFDPTQLLFLRRLRTAEVSVDGEKMMVRREDFPQVNKYNGEMRRLIVSKPGSHEEVVTDYMIVKKRIPVTHGSNKHPKAKETEVILAFPVASDCPVIEAQNAYNFLPVRKTSFFFLIQADFILAANREDVDDSHEGWNQMLLRALAQAFTLAALRFKDTPLKFSWIRFLPVDGEPCFALSMLPKLIRQNLGKASILLTSHETPVSGSEAVFIPQAFRIGDRNPLIDSAISLHKECDSSDFTRLRWLGVTTMSQQQFLSHLKTYVEVESGRQFREQKAAWHASLARILSDNQEISAAQIAKLPIIRLQDGRWVATKNNVITYEVADTNIMDRVPPGLDHIQLVHHSVASNPYGLRLLQKLGVKRFDSRQVCNLIISQHKRSTKPSCDMSVLISHAVYLFQAQHNLRGLNTCEGPMLWLCTSNGAVGRASALYVDDPQLDDPVSRHLAEGPAAGLVLHKEVVEAVGRGGCPWFQKH